MNEKELKAAIEAILFASGASVPLGRIAEALGVAQSKAKAILNELVTDYAEQMHGIEIIKLNDSYQMTTKKAYATEIRTVMDLKRKTPLSQAALEVLAVVAYNQPVTKAFVDQVRGVDCGGVIGSLCAKDLIEEKGRLELPGRPLLYGTTENFLRCFSLSSIDELPPLPERAEEQQETAEGQQ